MEKIYYSNGTLESVIEYKNDSIREGKASVYYSNGQLKREGYYINGKRHGPSVSFYSNGKLLGKEFYNFGKLLGSSYDYYENGGIMRYNSFDYEGDCFYLIKYDSLGIKIKEEGLVLARNAGEPNYKDVHNVGDSVILLFLIAEPPGYKTRANIVVYQLDAHRNRTRIIQSLKSYSIEKSVIKYEGQFISSGFYQVVCVGELIDTLHQWTKVDSTIATIEVR